MPVVPGLKQAADGAIAPLEVDYPPPDRQVHDHGFVGVDYPPDVGGWGALRADVSSQGSQLS